MDRHASYDPHNIFARILSGEMACYKIYEDDDVLAFLDIMPLSDGHLLVIPKAAAMNLLDITPQALTQVTLAAQKLAKVAMTALNADAVQLVQRSGEAAGQEVFHFHLHVIPRYKEIALKERELAVDGALKATQEKLIAALNQLP